MATRRVQRESDWRPAFLDALRETANVSLAANDAGVSRQEPYKRRDRDPERG